MLVLVLYDGDESWESNEVHGSNRRWATSDGRTGDPGLLTSVPTVTIQE